MTDLEKIQENPFNIQNINNPSEELCLIAIKQDGMALEYIKHQTPEFCLKAVKQDGWALKNVKKQTPELCLEAIKEGEYAVEYVTCFHQFNLEQIESIHSDIKKYIPELKTMSSREILKHFKKLAI